jgi:D-amino-acid dehydrogenase
MITGAHSNDSSFEADEFVISAGVYSSILAKKLGIYLPMQGGKGYSVTIKKPESLPEICSILVESRVAVTPMSGNLRLAGTMEIAGLDQSISKNRVNGYLKSVENYLPDFKYEKMDYKGIWVGLRPCSPDGIPYIGRTKKYKNLIFATGHSMMGLSLGPVSGKIISDIVSNRNDFPDLNQLTPDRFN